MILDLVPKTQRLDDFVLMAEHYTSFKFRFVKFQKRSEMNKYIIDLCHIIPATIVIYIYKISRTVNTQLKLQK